MYEELMLEVGLTKSEALVYQALIKLGPSTTGPIIKEAGVSSGKIYEIMDKLISKGLVSYVIRSGKKYFQPTNPERFLDYLEFKERKIERIKPIVKNMVDYFKEKLGKSEGLSNAEVFEGVEGFKTFSEVCLRTLKKDTDYCILGVSKEVNDLFGGYLLDWQKRRVAKGVPLRIIYDEDSKVYGKKRENLKNTQVRYLPKNMKTPALIEVFEDYVATMIVVPKPFIFLIKNKKAAESYLQYFNLIWKLAKKG